MVEARKEQFRVYLLHETVKSIECTQKEPTKNNANEPAAYNNDGAISMEKLNELRKLRKEEEKSDSKAVGGKNESIRFKFQEEELSDKLEGKLFAWASKPRYPVWYKFIESSVGTIDFPKTQSLSALIIIKVQINEELVRWFAIANGYSKSLLNENKIVKDFGVKVALNSINVAQVRSYDSKIIADSVFQTRKQSSRSVAVPLFEIDQTREILDSITGVPENDKILGSRVSGRDSVVFSVPKGLNDFPEIGKKLYDFYKDDKYKEHFDWVDNLRGCKDSEIIEKLNNKLSSELENLNNKASETIIYMATSEIADYENIIGYSFDAECKDGKIDEDLLFENYLNFTRGKSNDKIALDTLKKDKYYICCNENSVNDSRSVYSSLVCETEFNNEQYILFGGLWYCINKSWRDGIRKRISEIKSSDMVSLFPEMQKDEWEGCYNIRMAANSKINGVLADCKTVEQIELCDVFVRGTKGDNSKSSFIHVKKDCKSTKLSHLFNQGYVSSSLLKDDKEFRDSVSKKDFNGETILLKNFDAGDYRIIYLIASESLRGKPRNRLDLPLFSQITFLNVYKNLKSMGYEVYLDFIKIGKTKSKCKTEEHRGRRCLPNKTDKDAISSKNVETTKGVKK